MERAVLLFGLCFGTEYKFSQYLLPNINENLQFLI